MTYGLSLLGLGALVVWSLWKAFPRCAHPEPPILSNDKEEGRSFWRCPECSAVVDETVIVMPASVRESLDQQRAALQKTRASGAAENARKRFRLLELRKKKGA